MDSVEGARSLKTSSEECFIHECSPCENDGLVREARFLCGECGDYLCEPCETSHRRFRSTRKHEVRAIDGNEESKITARRQIQSTILCSCNGKGVTIFWIDHNDILCVDCKTLHHRSCDTCTIESKSVELKDPVVNVSVADADKLVKRIEKTAK